MAQPFVQFWMAQAPLGDGRTGVVEVIREPEADHPHMVLLSELVEGRLHCLMGFTTDPAECDAMNAKGFIGIEALIRLEGGVLKVRAAAFLPGQREIEYEHEWLSVIGVAFSHGQGGPLRREYLQVLTSPDLVRPADSVRMVPVVWSLDRQQVTKPKGAAARITIADLRWPKTLPLQDVAATDAWTGTIARPDGSDIWGEPVRHPARREQRPVEFRSPRSSFRAVEVLGVRLDIPRLDARRQFKTDETRQEQQEAELYGLIAPLNFHLPRKGEPDPADRSRPDFYYRPATSGLTIELLRYGQMSVAEAIGGLEPQDVQSQHELLVRVVVGRVDEDASQAQEVATFVPALFVDNTWSKHLGRQYMGLDKQLAHFCTRDGDELVPLSPRDAYDRRDPLPPPLSRIAEIRLAKGLLPELPRQPEAVEGMDPEKQKQAFKALVDEVEAQRKQLASEAPLLLTIDCDRDLVDGWEDFRAVPTDAVLRNSPLAARRWRQEDFEDAEVRRDFARAAGQGSAGAFLGTQGSPLVPDKDFLERWATQTWVSGRYSMTGSAMMARPRGKVTVTLHRVSGVEGWRRLCNLFEVPAGSGGVAGSKSFVLGPGSWYRLLYDMDLAMQNAIG